MAVKVYGGIDGTSYGPGPWTVPVHRTNTGSLEMSGLPRSSVSDMITRAVCRATPGGSGRLSSGVHGAKIRAPAATTT